MFISTSRVIKFAFTDFWRNLGLSLMTISILMLTYVSLNLLVLVNFFTETAIQSVESRVDVSVYFGPDVSDDRIHGVRGNLSTLPEVKEVIFISREEALATFKANHVEDEDIIEALNEVGENPLGAVLVIKAEDATDFGPILEYLQSDEVSTLVEDKTVEDHRGLVERLVEITGKIERAALAITLMFALISLLIVFNTIRVAIYIHREEIAIMRLVGASSNFVRMPFLIEVVMYNVVALGIVMLALFPLLQVMEPSASSFFATNAIGLEEYFRAGWVKIFGYQMVTVTFLSLVAAWLSMRRYLKK